jgi:outer membrane protein TolC
MKSIAIILSAFLWIPFLAKAQNDSTRNLDYYLEAGVKYSPLLKDYSNQILSSQLDSLVIRAQNRPQVSANGIALYAPAYQNFGYDAAITNGGTYALQIAATQNILNRNILKPQYQQAAIQGQMLRNTSKLSEHDLKHNITSQYLAAWSDWKQLEITGQTYKVMKQEEVIIKPLVENGMMKQTAYLAFTMELQTQALSLNQLRIQYNIDLMTLNILCGLKDTSTSVKLQEPTLVKNTLRYNYFRSPIFMQYHLDSLQLINQRALIDTRYKPRLSLNADAGFLSSTPDFYSHPGFSAGVMLSAPIFDGRQRAIEYRRIGLQDMTRLNYISYSRTQYDLQYIMLNNQLNASRELVDNLQAQLKKSEDLIGMSRIELNRGDISVTDFLLILRNNIDIRNNLNQGQVKLWQIINDINYWNWE